MNKFDVESEIAVKTASELTKQESYLTHNIDDLLEFDLRPSQYLHWDVDGEFSRVNGLSAPRPCKQVGLIIWLFLSEGYAVHIFLSSLNFYQNKFIHDSLFQSKEYKLDKGILICYTLHTVIFIVMFFYGYLATVSDPTDKSIYY